MNAQLDIRILILLPEAQTEGAIFVDHTAARQGFGQGLLSLGAGYLELRN